MARIRLNQAQQQAADHDLGPLLVLAGAGSGKTGVVTTRIAKLIARGVPARAILAMTFTNKAAAEMHERVVRSAGAKASRGLLVCTFHRFGLEVLSRETKALGLRGGSFAIFDRGDCSGVTRDLLRNIGGDRNFDVGAILNRISLAKNAFLDPEKYAAKVANSEDEYDEITAMLYPRYEEALRSLQAYDFDDLVCEPVRLWRRREDVLERWRMRFRYLIVDEYQDTNQAQLAMLRMLAEEHRNLCVVGDDDQAIYAWRGADVRNILDFERHFKGTKVVRLERNYRSSEAVLAVANAVLKASRAKRHPKKLIPTRGAGAQVKLVTAIDGEAEARFMAEEIHRLVKSGEARAGDFAILYRSNLQAPELESELKARGVPYRLYGGTQTFERKEVKDVLAYLAVAADPHNELAVRRSLSYPPRGIGEVTMRHLGSHATAYDLTLWQAIERAHAITNLNDRARQACREYARLVLEVRRGLDAGEGVRAATAALVESIDLKRTLWAEAGRNNKAAARRWANIQFLLRAFERREQRGPLDRDALKTFLRVLLLREEGKEDESGDTVTLTTMHGSKGLEFRYVFLAGLEEGLLPHSRTLDERATDVQPLGGQESDEIEQERRLFYVAVTRAREHLYLCHAQGRPSRGRMMKRVASRFVLELPEELLDKYEVSEQGPVDASEAHRGAQDVLAALLGK